MVSQNHLLSFRENIKKYEFNEVHYLDTLKKVLFIFPTTTTSLIKIFLSLLVWQGIIENRKKSFPFRQDSLVKVLFAHYASSAVH